MNPIYAHQDNQVFDQVDHCEDQIFNDDGTNKYNNNAWLFINELNMLYPVLFNK